MDRFKRILVPVDGTKGCIECIRLACHIARQNNSDIHILHVLNLSVIQKISDLSKENSSSMVDKAKLQAEGYFKDLLTQIKAESDIPYKITKKIMQGKIVDEEIINYAQHNKMDLIIINLSSKKHASDIIMGHITLRVVEFAKIPVLVIPVSIPAKPEWME